MSKRAGCCLLQALLLVVLGRLSPASAFPVAPLLRVDGVHFETPIAMRLSGQPLWLRAFRSRLPPGAAAYRLRRLPVELDRALRRPDGGLLLSGLQDGWHWLVEIHADKAGSQGRISALCVQGCSNGSPTPLPVLSGAADAGLVIEQPVGGGTARIVWRIEALQAEVSQGLALLDRQLRFQGWQPDDVGPVASGRFDTNWRRQDQHLFVRVLDVAGHGKYLLLRHE